MFPSSHDLQPEHLSHITLILGRLLRSGNRVLVVTKPHLDVVSSICDSFSDYRRQVLFRFSIGSVDTRRLRFWEPNAPTFGERIAALRHAFGRGFQTSVSCEPMLDKRTDLVLERTLPFVTDAVWVGKPNFLMGRLRANGEADETTMAAARRLLGDLSDAHIVCLYNAYRHNPKVKWKESVKKTVGLTLSESRGRDT
jgi:DNA repair photolyase